ncbi:MAG: VOC family protein [Marmoricola sp.]|nr:VOC family protein [Marmoricola sp.]
MPTSGADEGPGVEGTIARPGGVSYVRIPALDVQESARFYQEVLGWVLDGDPAAPSFHDGTGHVIGHWRTDMAVADGAGIVPYVYVTDLDHTLERVTEHGGRIVHGPYPEGSLRIATVHDPAGNLIGIWQGPR